MMAAPVWLILTACLSPGVGIYQPTAAELIAALNANARRMRILRCDHVAIDVVGNGKSIGLDGVLVARYPLDFRMRLKVAGIEAADMGSNAREAWCWLSKAELPWVLRATHRDLAAGRAKFPVPGGAAWLMQVLGVGEYDRRQGGGVTHRGGFVELAQRTREPDGSRLRRVTVLKRKGKSYEAVGYRIEDEHGKVLCRADIMERFQDPASGASLPRKLKLHCPKHRTTMQIELWNSRVLPALDPEKAKLYFARPDVP